MAKSFKLPDLGEGIHEGEVFSVLVAVGDMVKEGDPILEVETDKATAEIPSPCTGTVLEILVKPHDVVNVGAELMIFDVGVESRPAAVPSEAAESSQPQIPEPEEKPPTQAPSESTESSKPETPSTKKEPVPASPSTRRLARELNVELHDVTPSGPAGLVTAEDVRQHAEKAVEAPETVSPSEERPLAVQPEEEISRPEGRPITVSMAALPDFSQWGPVERVPVRAVRRSTARQMVLSWSQIPHVYNQDWVDITELENFRRKHKADIEASGGRLTLLVFVMKAIAAALKAFPDFNASLDMESGEIIYKRYYHIGFAADTDDGLLVPVIRNADRKSITELAIELKTTSQNARDRKLSLAEMQGGTFTITNAGPMGGGHFAPIINYPQVAILGMGQARMQPAVDEKNTKKIVARRMLPIVVCFDHRIIDGAHAIRFMQMVMKMLKDPEKLFMAM